MTYVPMRYGGVVVGCSRSPVVPVKWLVDRALGIINLTSPASIHRGSCPLGTVKLSPEVVLSISRGLIFPSIRKSQNKVG